MALIYKLLASVIIAVSVAASIPFTQLERAFSNNDAQAIVAMGKDKILMNIQGKEGVYSQSQATLVLKDFFVRRPGTAFHFTYKGKETDEGCFAVGNYVSKSETFRVSIHFTKIGDSYRIENLSIE